MTPTETATAYASLEAITNSVGGFDLRLMPSLSDTSAIPSSGTSLMVVASVSDVLTFRVFDTDGTTFADTNESALAGESVAISALKTTLTGLWPPHTLTIGEIVSVTTSVASIVGYTKHWPVDPTADQKTAIDALKTSLGFPSESIGWTDPVTHLPVVKTYFIPWGTPIIIGSGVTTTHDRMYTVGRALGLKLNDPDFQTKVAAEITRRGG